MIHLQVIVGLAVTHSEMHCVKPIYLIQILRMEMMDLNLS